MPVGTGSIKRAAKAAAPQEETVKEEETKALVKQTKAPAKKAIKQTAKPAVKAAVKPVENTQKTYGLYEELPVYLL